MTSSMLHMSLTQNRHLLFACIPLQVRCIYAVPATDTAIKLMNKAWGTYPLRFFPTLIGHWNPLSNFHGSPYELAKCALALFKSFGRLSMLHNADSISLISFGAYLASYIKQILFTDIQPWSYGNVQRHQASYNPRSSNFLMNNTTFAIDIQSFDAGIFFDLYSRSTRARSIPFTILTIRKKTK